MAERIKQFNATLVSDVAPEPRTREMDVEYVRGYHHGLTMAHGIITCQLEQQVAEDRDAEETIQDDEAFEAFEDAVCRVGRACDAVGDIRGQDYGSDVQEFVSRVVNWANQA